MKGPVSISRELTVVHYQRTFSLAQRWILLAAGIAIFCLLLVARALQPDPGGYGTHQQLGLPPCTFVALFGKPCPSCGMTTAWAHVTRGHFEAAIAANAGGTLLCFCAILASPWLIVSATFQKWLILRPTERGLFIFAMLVGAVVLLDWLFKVDGLL